MHPTDPGRVVCSVIRTCRGTYAYDAWSNQILRLTAQEATIAEAMSKGASSARIIEILAERHRESDPAELLREFSVRTRELDALQPVALRPVAPPVSMDEVRRHLSTGLQSVVLNVTEDCSMRCRYCVFGDEYPGRRNHSPKSMSLETACKAIRFFLERSSATDRELAFCFYGGEPLLRLQFLRDVFGFIEDSTRNREVGFHLTTNGLALRKAAVRAFLVENDVAILVSLDGPARIHDEWRVTEGGHATHFLVERGLVSLLREHPDYYRRKVMFSTVLTPPAATSEVREYFTSSVLFKSSTQVVRMSNMERHGSDLFERRFDREAAARESGRTRLDFVENRKRDSAPLDCLSDLYNVLHARIAQRRIEPLPSYVVPSGYCIPGGRKLFVAADGTLGMCEKVAEQVRIGDLDSGFDFAAIEASIARLGPMWSAKCSFCPAQRFCGVCPAQVLDGNGDMPAEHFAAECHANRTSFLEGLHAFVAICEDNPGYFRQMEEVELA